MYYSTYRHGPFVGLLVILTQCGVSGLLPTPPQFVELNKTLGAYWKSMTDAQKQPYEVQAELDRRRYAQEMKEANAAEIQRQTAAAQQQQYQQQITGGVPLFLQQPPPPAQGSQQYVGQQQTYQQQPEDYQQPSLELPQQQTQQQTRQQLWDGPAPLCSAAALQVRARQRNISMHD